MNSMYEELLPEIIHLSKQSSSAQLLLAYLTVLSKSFGGSSAGIVLTNLENTQFERCFSLRTRQKKVVGLSAFTDALGCELPDSPTYNVSVILLPLAFANVFGIAFVVVSSQPEDRESGISNLLSEHFAVCYSTLDKFESQHKRIQQLEERLSKEVQANSLNTKRNRRLIEASLIGSSPQMKVLRSSIQLIATSNFNVLIRGETGTGKELVAKEIHRLSTQFSGKFIAQNCAAIPLDLLESELFGHEKGAFTGADKKKQGLLAAADNGVLFLDEVGDMPMSLQSKLLRVLQERVYRPVGSTQERQACFRLVAATHQPLEDMVKAGTFRRDLFYRLQESLIRVPTLGERKTDIEALSLHFIKQYEADNNASQIILSNQALARLTDHQFPGNVRELRNIIRQSCLSVDDNNHISQSVVETLLVSSALLMPADDPSCDEVCSNLKESCQQFELMLIRKALGAVGGDRNEAAKKLAIPVRTLSHKCQKYGL